MSWSTKRIWALVLALLAGVYLAGCVAHKTAPSAAPIFYPPLPNPPRLQFLTSFNGAGKWITPKSSLRDFIVGAPKTTTDTGEISNPYGVAAWDGKIYVCDLGLHRVLEIDPAGKTFHVLGTPDEIQNPVNITIDRNGTKYVCDTRLGKVAVFNAQDKFVGFLGDPNRCAPSDLAIWHNELFVSNDRAADVEVWSRSGKLLRTIGSHGEGPGQLLRPSDLAVDAQGHVFVSDTFASVVDEFDNQGHFLRYIGSPGDRPGNFARPKGIVVDPNGNLFVADAQWQIVQAFTEKGQLLIYFGGASSKPQGMTLPAGLAIASDPQTLAVFHKYLAPGFTPEYLLFVANQYGDHKIGVYAFGREKGMTYTVTTRPASTQPASRPASANRPGVSSDKSLTSR